MDLKQLRAFAVVAEEGGFTRAAARLHLAQPAVSKQVARLEAELGVELLRRTARAVTPTEAGELLLHRARRALAEVDAAKAELDELQGLLRGHVVVGAMQSLGPVDLPGLLARFHHAHPQVEITVREEPTPELEQLLVAGAVDLAFTTGRPDGPAELQGERVAEEDLVVVLAQDHRLARRGRRRIGLGALAEEPWVAFKGGTGLRTAFERATAAAGVAPRIAFESNELDRVIALVARDLGVSVVPRSTAEAAREPVAVLEITPRLTREVALLWPRERRLAPAARALLDLARAAR